MVLVFGFTEYVNLFDGYLFWKDAVVFLDYVALLYPKVFRE